MKILLTLIPGTFLTVACVSLQAAPCVGTPLNRTAIQTLLNDKSVHAQNPTTGEDWKEDHCSNGKLYKVGDPNNAAVDPRDLRGSWSVTETVMPLPGGATLTLGVVHYTYTKGASPTTYSFYLVDDGGTYRYCDTAMPPQRAADIISLGPLTGGC